MRNTDTQTELVRSPSYNVAGQLTQWERRSELASGSGTSLMESFTFTTQGQVNLHRMKVSSANAYFVDDEYVYDDAGDGTVKQRKDNAAGDAVDYKYNILGQLIKAETTSSEWGQSFVFDGFGNLTQQVVTKGSAPSMTLNVNPANNRVTGSGISYDAAGNLTSTLYGGGMTYDLASRQASVQGMTTLRYTARNERLTVLKSDGTREVHMRGLGGEMIGVYRIDWGQNSMYTRPVRLAERERVYAAGRLLFEGGKFVATDRLGSAVYKFSQGLALVNGGMETGVAPWYAYYGAQAEVSYVPHTGGRSLRVTTPIVDRGVYQEVKGLVAGMTYQFQAWVRAESGTSLAALAVCDSSYNGFVWTGVRTATTDWQQLTVTFTATGQGVARVHLAKHDTTGALLWDDVELAGGEYAISGVKMRYYPYGQEIGTATANDVAKFGTYTRDASSGLDYAMNRYYQSTWGRFTTADPYRASGGPGDPGSWNRYSYVQGDPVNYSDPAGQDKCPPGYVCHIWNPYSPEPNNELAQFMVNYNSQSPAKSPSTDPTRVDAGIGTNPGRQPDALAMALNIAYWAIDLILSKYTWSSDCESSLGLLGISPFTLQEAARRVSILDGTTSTETVASLYAGAVSPSLVRATRGLTQSISSEFALPEHAATSAMSDLGGNRIFINPNYFSSYLTGGAVMTMFHELAHNASGYTDSDIQRLLGLPEENNTQRISIRLFSDCWH